jgi:hypothetical protein
MIERFSRTRNLARSPWWAYLASALVVAFAYSLCRRAINLTDEGYLLSQVVDMLDGKILYRDMDAFVTPGIWFLLAGLFKLVEPSVLASRILSFAGYLGTLYVSYRIIMGLTSRAWAWSTVGLLMVFSIWAFPAWTTVFYSPFAILFALMALERLLEWRGSERSRDLVLCGLFLGLSILCKQNYGAFATAGTLIALLLFRLETREPLADALRGLFMVGTLLAAGALSVLLPTVAYLAYQSALIPAFELLVLHPFEFMNRQDIGYPSLSMLWAATPLAGVDSLTYGAFSFSQAPNPFYSTNPALLWIHFARLLERMHILLYWLPVLGMLVGVAYAFRPSDPRRKIDGNLIAVLSVAGFVFLGVFPRADFNHLINVYQPVIIASVLVAHRVFTGSTRPWTIPARVGITFGCTFLFLYTAVAGSWYLHTLSALNVPVAPPRGGVLVTPIDREMIEFQVGAIQERTSDDEYVLTVPALAMFNFLADRRMPGRYYNLYEHHIAHDEGAGVVDAAEALDVDLVVSDYNNFFSDRVGLRVYAPKLAKYLRSHFEPEFDVAADRFRYLRKRNEPLEERASTDLIGTCDLDDPKRSSYAREHLLFASLYQARNKKRPNAPIDTSCTFEVPEDATLAVSINYRRPAAVARNTTLRAEIWLDEAGQSEPLLSEVIRVESQNGWTTPPAPEFRVDLADFAGREVTLRFRAIFRGRVRMSPLDLGGFALVWQDPRVETD